MFGRNAPSRPAPFDSYFRVIVEGLEVRRLLSGDPTSWPGVTVLAGGVVLVPTEVAAAQRAAADDTLGFFSTTPPATTTGAVPWGDTPTGETDITATSCDCCDCSDSCGEGIITVSVDIDPLCGPASEEGPKNSYFVFTGASCQPGTSGVTVRYTMFGTAIAGEDYTGALTSGSVSVPSNGETWVPFDPVDDATPELTESVDVTILEDPAYAIGDGDASNFIEDNDNAAIVSIAPVEDALEPSLARGQFRVTRTGYLSSSLDVRFEVSGTATDAVDYDQLPDTIVIPAGSTEVFLDVTPKLDSEEDDGETVIITLLEDEPPPGEPKRYLLAQAGVGGTPPTTNPATSQIVIADVWVQSVTWEGSDPGDGQTNLSEDNPASHGGGFRLFPDKNAPGAAGKKHNTVWARAVLNRKVPAGKNVTVYFRLFDVDDPTGNPANDTVSPIDPNDIAGSPHANTKYIGDDNRGTVGSTIGSVVVPGGFDVAKTLYDLKTPNAGDNFRVFATTDLTVMNAVHVDPDYQSGLSSVNGFRTAQDQKPDIKYSSPVLAIWRKLHVERDSMAAPPAGEPFGGATDDVDPGGALANPSIDLAQTNFRDAFIEVVDDLGALDMRDGVSWKHNVELVNFVPVMMEKQDVQGDADFWVHWVIGAYEGPVNADFDDDPAGTSPVYGGTYSGVGSLIFLETLRDRSAFPGPDPPKSVAFEENVRRTVLHEMAHIFAGLEGDEGHQTGGPLSDDNNNFGDDAANKLTPVQIDLIRDETNPSD